MNSVRRPRINGQEISHAFCQESSHTSQAICQGLLTQVIAQEISGKVLHAPDQMNPELDLDKCTSSGGWLYIGPKFV